MDFCHLLLESYIRYVCFHYWYYGFCYVSCNLIVDWHFPLILGCLFITLDYLQYCYIQYFFYFIKCYQNKFK